MLEKGDVQKSFNTVKVKDIKFRCSLHTREHHLNQVSFVDVFCRGQPLQDVLVV